MGLFFSSFFVVSGLALPLVLAHVLVVKPWAMVLSLAGGVFVYISIAAYLYLFFVKKEADDFL